MAIRPGHRRDLFEGLDIPEAELRDFLAAVPFAEMLTPGGRSLVSPTIHVPATFTAPKVAEGRKQSTQAVFGDILAEIAAAMANSPTWPSASSPPARM